ncbi:MAG: RnfH family protein [Candidatus Neomarinimicrobiota bacterium]
MESENSISIVICYAISRQQELISLNLSQPTSVLSAIQQSGILEKYVEIDLERDGVGIYGQIVKLDKIVQDKDRIEIYRPLQVDPMKARRIRAEQQDN